MAIKLVREDRKNDKEVIPGVFLTNAFVKQNPYWETSPQVISIAEVLPDTLNKIEGVEGFLFAVANDENKTIPLPNLGQSVQAGSKEDYEKVLKHYPKSIYADWFYIGGKEEQTQGRVRPSAAAEVK